MIVERLELRMMPQPAGVTARHAHDVRRAGHLRGEMSGNAIGLQVVRKDDVKRMRGMHPGRNGRELGHERARHRNVRLRTVDRIGPVHCHRSAADAPRIAPSLLPACACETAGGLLGVGHDVNLMSRAASACAVQ